MAPLNLMLLCLFLPYSLATPSSLASLLSSPQFSGFSRLLNHADVIPEIEASLKEGSLGTIFAPTNDALMYHTSPTVLAFLKQAENKETLRQILLSHFVTEALSPFHWEGTHRTLAGTDLPLSSDAIAFYFGGVAVTQYSAVRSPMGPAVHTVATLILPSSFEETRSLSAEGEGLRRVLQAAGPAMAPAPAPETAAREPSTPAPSSATSLRGAALYLVGASLAALALL